MTTRTLKLVLAVALCAAAAGCQTNPATGRPQYLMLSPEQELSIGEENKGPLTEEFGGKVADPELTNYVNNIGRQLAAQTEADFPELPWEFTLLDSGVINAFALPGGKVFISRGLAAEMTNEAQMAAVLGHEIGHVTGRHTSERMGQALGTSIGGAIVGAAVGAAVGGKDAIGVGAAGGATVGQVVALSYSRDQEIEADRLGMRYMEKLKYDPVGAIEVQQILQRASQGGQRPPEWLSTHPASETRINELNKRYDKYYAHTRGNPEYQKHEERFQRQFLAQLNKLPPPPPPPPPRPAAGHHPRTPEGARALMLAAAFHDDGAGAFGSLGDPAGWCWHCAALPTFSRTPQPLP